MLTAAFPTLTILPNDKTLLGGYELDIAIPELSLAIEWNGIVHFEPIYGETKLNTIQQHDADKMNTANEKGIHLIVVPDLVSTPNYVKEAFLTIKKIINGLLLEDTGRSRTYTANRIACSTADETGQECGT